MSSPIYLRNSVPSFQWRKIPQVLVQNTTPFYDGGDVDYDDDYDDHMDDQMGDKML